MTIGEKLKQLRLASKRTLKQHGDFFCVSMNTVYRWEHDLVMPRKDTLKKISAHYNVPMVWLMCDDNESYESHNAIDRQFLSLLNKLTVQDQYKVLGYLERTYMESLSKIGGGEANQEMAQ